MITAIVPAALLHREGLSQSNESAAAESWIFRDPDGLHYVVICQDGNVTDWRFWPSDDESECALDPSLIVMEVLSSHPNLPIAVAGAESDIVAELNRVGLDTIVLAGDVTLVDELIWLGARSIWKRPNAALNLAVGPLAGTSSIDSAVSTSRMLLSSLIVLLLVAAAAFSWRGYQLQGIIQHSQQEHIELYRSTFPDVPVPLAVASRFDSQHRAIVGQRGGIGQIKFPASVLVGLKSVLEAHQTPLRSRFQEIVIDDESVEIECEFRSHQEASRMVGLLGTGVRPIGGTTSASKTGTTSELVRGCVGG